MIRSLWTGALGMMGQQTNIDVVSNNLANVNTTGFKQSRVEFEDLLYQQLETNISMPTREIVIPRGIEIGLGVKVSATQKSFEQGSLKQTNNPMDIALSGNGFFKVILPNGELGYTRDGSFKIDANRQIVSSSGYKLFPETVFPEGYIPEEIKITPEGVISVRTNDDIEHTDVGQFTTYRFVNPAGLHSVGDNLYKETQASGKFIEGIPGIDGQPITLQGFVENSNVKMVDAMVDLITAQRAYEFNSKTITTSDNMLQTAISMKR